MDDVHATYMEVGSADIVRNKYLPTYMEVESADIVRNKYLPTYMEVGSRKCLELIFERTTAWTQEVEQRQDAYMETYMEVLILRAQDAQEQ